MAQTIDEILFEQQRRAPDFLGTVADLLRKPGTCLFQCSEYREQQAPQPVLPLYQPLVEQKTEYTLG